MTSLAHTSQVKLSAKGQILAWRSELLWSLRSFFRAEGFLELEPPSIVNCPGMEPHLDAFEVIAHHAYHGGESLSSLPTRRWLHTSPEHALKRLLGEGFERIYSIGSCFRDEPVSKTHNPEFTMLEWYCKQDTLEDLMLQCERLIQTLALCAHSLYQTSYPQDDAHLNKLFALSQNHFERLSVQEAFLLYAKINLADHQSYDALRTGALTAGLSHRSIDATRSWDELYFQIFLDLVEPQLGKKCPVFLYDFPASQSALAKLKASDPRWALRFELFYQAHELANAFDELTDPDEQRARFHKELMVRTQIGASSYPIDEALLTALPTLGQCVGIALGFDRLVMLLLNQQELSAVLPQPWLQP